MGPAWPTSAFMLAPVIHLGNFFLPQHLHLFFSRYCVRRYASVKTRISTGLSTTRNGCEFHVVWGFTWIINRRLIVVIFFSSIIMGHVCPTGEYLRDSETHARHSYD